MSALPLLASTAALVLFGCFRPLPDDDGCYEKIGTRYNDSEDLSTLCGDYGLPDEYEGDDDVHATVDCVPAPGSGECERCNAEDLDSLLMESARNFLDGVGCTDAEIEDFERYCVRKVERIDGSFDCCRAAIFWADCEWESVE